MSRLNHKRVLATAGLQLTLIVAALLLAGPASAATPGITGTSFSLSAEAAYISQPDGAMIYSWGYGCLNGTPPAGGFLPTAIGGAVCPSMQIPGPTIIVHEGDPVTVTLTNNLPAAAGNTSILFPGFDVQTSGGVPGLLTQEAVHGGTVTYNFTASTPGTRSYYSGTRGDLQVEMGLYGIVVVIPTAVPLGCRAVASTLPDGQTDYRLAASAYDHPATCYDREYVFQASEMDPVIHRQAEVQKDLPCSDNAGCMTIRTENYHPAYYLLNGRSMPDDMDAQYSVQYPHQPYNANIHMHPGEIMLLRIVGQGRLQHPFHEHANHVRVVARDGNLLLSASDPTKLAGPLLFTTTTTPGQTIDGLFYWTARGLNWDVYGHGYPGDPSDCFPDENGYYTRLRSTPNVPDSASHEPNYYEWCADHNKPLEAHPFGNVGSGGPVTLPDPNIFTDGAWYGGSPFLGPFASDGTNRAVGPTPIPPSGTVINDPNGEAGFAYMWHTHNEREITTNNIFPGGMMTMMLVDPQAFVINESK